MFSFGVFGMVISFNCCLLFLRGGMGSYLLVGNWFFLLFF